MAMIQMLFSLRFQSQLRRTRPETVAALEKALVNAMESAGGKTRLEYRCVAATFDEETPGFWLDIALILESLRSILEAAASDLYGYACLLGRDSEIGENGIALVRLLPADLEGSGFWCTRLARQALSFYAVFEDAAGGGKNRDFFQIETLHSVFRDGEPQYYPFSEKIQNALKQNSARQVILVGPDFIGKREGLFRFCRQRLGDFPPLLVRFGSGGTGIACFWDALTPSIRQTIRDRGSSLAELDALGFFLARERLGEDFSPYVIEKADRFFRLLLEIYCAAAEDRGLVSILVLEDLHLANPAAAKIIVGACNALEQKDNFFVYGTSSAETLDSIPRRFFSRTLRFAPDDFPALHTPELPADLWEIAYAAFLFRHAFPLSLLIDLFKEEGKNPAMVFRALDMLLSLGVIDFADDPLPRIYDFQRTAETFLGERKEKIRVMVRNRLLAHVAAGKLRPCYNLLRMLAALEPDRTLSPELILDTFKADLAGGTYGALQRAIDESQLNLITKTEQIPPLLYIFKTLGALLHGTEKEIRLCFAEPPPEGIVPAYGAQISKDQAAFHLGIHDTKTAADLVKDAMLSCHNSPGNKGLARAYRLFSLVNLSNKRLSEALDYFSFAVEQAEKSEDFGELGISAYYASGAHFLYGNISKAERLALQAEQAAFRVGRSSWADKARFLRGKLRFESGRYRDAEELFENLKNSPLGTLPAGAEAVLDAWIYRSRIYQNDEAAIAPERGCWDTPFFEAEAAYLRGDYQYALELAEQLLAEPADRNILETERAEQAEQAQPFLFIEQPDWRSGFTQSELYLLPPKDFWGPLISAYRNLSLCRVSRADGSFREEGRQNMQRIVQDERLSEMDPNGPFFFYAWYRVLEESGAAEVDMNTAVSMAFKRLQRRASRIDDPDTRRSFLTLHFWNSALGEAAKEHKLI